MWPPGGAESLNRSNLERASLRTDSFHRCERFLVTRLVQFDFDCAGEAACLELETN